MVSDDTNLLLWPCIDTGEDKIDPLRDCVELLKYCVTLMSKSFALHRWNLVLMVKKNTN